MATEEKLIWNRIKESAKQEINQYADALFISNQMLLLAEEKLKQISGQVLK